ncbi:MAG: nitroreductase family protein [Bacteroidetes bacterium]|nr:MAG: nitroreductase family protein [Bacteroidota bacterium]
MIRKTTPEQAEKVNAAVDGRILHLKYIFYIYPIKSLKMRYLLTAGMLIICMFTNLEVMSQQTDNDVLTIIHQRKSVRQYQDISVPEDKIETMLRAAMAAPTARNIQPWQFYVITSREILDQLAGELPYAKMLSQAPLAIVVAGDTPKGNPNEEQIHNWKLDCAAATQNLLLAAEALGLGAVWTGVYPYKARIAAVSEALDLPSHIIPLNIIPIGYPLLDDRPKDKWDAEKVKWVE